MPRRLQNFLTTTESSTKIENIEGRGTKFKPGRDSTTKMVFYGLELLSHLSRVAIHYPNEQSMRVSLSSGIRF